MGNPDLVYNDEGICSELIGDFLMEGGKTNDCQFIRRQKNLEDWC